MSTKIHASPRLSSIIDKISAKTIADIGADHAYIPITAVFEKKCDRAIACDIRTGPLEIAARNVKKYGLEDRISLRLGAGLSAIEAGEADGIIIAGMGGIMIRDIIKADIEKAKSADSLILQPMNCAHELRRYLFDSGFAIPREDIAVEGRKVYNILVCEKGEESAEEIELHIPSKLRQNKNFDIFLNKKIREFSKIVSGIEKAAERSEREEEILKRYRTLLKEAMDMQKGTRL